MMNDESGADSGDSVRRGIDVISGSLGLLVRRLEFCRTRLKAMGFRVSRHGRVSRAIQLLGDASEERGFPTAPDRIEALCDAIGLAFALIQVVDALPHPVPPGLRLSLWRSLRGSLGDTGASEHRRALSELRFAACLAAAGVPIGAPRPRPTKTPDFVATVDSFDFLIEVKRPSSETAVPNKIDEAVSQCRKYADRPTCVVLDLTDLLPHSQTVGTPSFVEQANRVEFNRISQAAQEYVVAKREAGATDVAGLFTYCEPVMWDRPGPGRLPTSVLQIAFRVYADCKYGIVHVSSRRLMQHSIRGLDLLAGKLNALTREELLGLTG